jgi:hypothetical protein
VCLLVFLLARGVVGLVSLLTRRRHRDDPPRDRDDDLVLAA